MNSLPPNFLLSAGPATMRVCASFANPAGGTPAMTAADLTSRCLLRTGLPSTLGARRSTGFTLIELLVVISIIAILAGLAFPAVNGALNSARKAQAKNDVQQIVAAVKAFQSEYGRMPSSIVGEPSNVMDDSEGGGSDSAKHKIILDHLMGVDRTFNTKGIVFLDPKTTTGTKGGYNSSTGIFYDPWGTSYFIKLDTNYDGKIEYYGNGSVANVFGSSLAVSVGPDKELGNPFLASGTGKDDICSFK
jgi:prepilin-type N-terminal cleavage/methylation domain-containing protein